MNMPSDKIRQLREKLLAHGDSGKVLVTEKGIGSGKDMQRKEETAAGSGFFIYEGCLFV